MRQGRLERELRAELGARSPPEVIDALRAELAQAVASERIASEAAATAAQEPSSNPRTPSIFNETTLRNLGAPMPKTALSGRAQDCAGV